MKIALCQTPGAGNKDEGLQLAAQYIAKAADEGAQLVVLPEMFCCPYSNDAFKPNAEPAGGRVWQFLRDAARGHGVILVGGSFPELDDAGRVYNTCFVFDAAGEQIGRHRKMHLFDIDIPGGQKFRESDTLSPGSDVTLIDTPWGKIGIIICFDVRFPELARLLALRGAAALIMPGAFNMSTGPAHWELLMRARAVDNGLYVLACAPARDETAGYVSYAHSMAVTPWGDPEAQLGTAPGIVHHTLDMQKVTAMRAQIPMLTARREDVYRLTIDS